MRRTVHRRDTNHATVLSALRAVTWVADISQYGGGMGDILARHIRTGAPMFLEIKDGALSPSRRKLTASETVFASVFGPRGYWVKCVSVDEALRAVGATTETRPL